MTLSSSPIFYSSIGVLTVVIALFIVTQSVQIQTDTAAYWTIERTAPADSHDCTIAITNHTPTDHFTLRYADTERSFTIPAGTRYDIPLPCSPTRNTLRVIHDGETRQLSI